MSEGYQGLPKSDKWGCLMAAVLGVPVFLFLLGLDALGDCKPDTTCQKGFLMMVLMPSLIIAGVVFWSVRTIVRRRHDDS